MKSIISMNTKHENAVEEWGEKSMSVNMTINNNRIYDHD